MKRKIITVISIICIAALCIGAAIAVSLSHKIPGNPVGTVGNTAGITEYSVKMINTSILQILTITALFTG